MKLVILRHGRTAWNEAGRIQGRQDEPLDDFGMQQVRSWKLPAGWREYECVTSPLTRAKQTAQSIGFPNATVDERLIEMDWGSFCGRTLHELRTKYGQTLQDNEDKGLDFRPDGGESPREVTERVRKLLFSFASAPSDRVCVTHKGVRRAFVVLAFGWDMLGKPPLKLSQNDALVIELDLSGKLRFVERVSMVSA